MHYKAIGVSMITCTKFAMRAFQVCACHSLATCYYKVRPSCPRRSGDGWFTVDGIGFPNQPLPLEQIYDLIMLGNT